MISQSLSCVLIATKATIYRRLESPGGAAGSVRPSEAELWVAELFERSIHERRLPDVSRVSPVSQPESSDARNTAIGAMSLGCAIRPGGVCDSNCFWNSLPMNPPMCTPYLLNFWDFHQHPSVNSGTPDSRTGLPTKNRSRNTAVSYKLLLFTACLSSRHRNRQSCRTLTKVIEGHLTKSIPKAVTPSALCQMLYGPHESASENRDVLWRKTLECVRRETARRSARREPCTASCGADAADQNLTRKQTICAHHCGEGRTAETATGSGD